MSKIIQEITADGLHLPTAEGIAELACIFLLEKVGDAAAIKRPKKKDDKWIVDVVLPHARKDLGTLVFTANGKLMSDSTIYKKRTRNL